MSLLSFFRRTQTAAQPTGEQCHLAATNLGLRALDGVHAFMAGLEATRAAYADSIEVLVDEVIAIENQIERLRGDAERKNQAIIVAQDEIFRHARSIANARQFIAG